ncbi:MAG: hypothetical protein ABIR57_06620 [Aeromicrobium sp.]
MSNVTTKTLRKFWRTLEAIHTVVYFAPETRAAYKAIGLRGYWSGYFASRSAPLGTPSAELVTATFFGFAPDMVAKAIPDAWNLADRDEILATRKIIATRALESILGDEDVLPVADSLLAAAGSLSFAGRPLAAAHHALPSPETPMARLWHATSVLREYRGDGHLAVLTAANVGPVDSNILQVGIGKVGDDQQALRGWSDEEWAAGHERLRARGWIQESGSLTELGLAEREEIEALTDATSDPAIAHLANTPVADSLLTWARAISKSGAIPFPNATGVPKA